MGYLWLSMAILAVTGWSGFAFSMLNDGIGEDIRSLTCGMIHTDDASNSLAESKAYNAPATTSIIDWEFPGPGAARHTSIWLAT